MRAQNPQSILDVGCGNGFLLLAAANEGIEVCGVEAKAEKVEGLCRQGLSARCAPAEELPFAGDAFDWVTMRHVAHHCRRPEQAFAEAARVARSGIVVAEPWYDPDLPDHATAIAIDTWVKRQDRRLGHPHFENLKAAELMQILQKQAQWKFEYEYVMRPALKPMDEVEEFMRDGLHGLSEQEEDFRLFRTFLQRAKETGVAFNGSVIVTAFMASSS